MFQKRSMGLFIVFLIGVVSLIGCTNSSSFKKLAKQDQTLVWSGERTKAFGEYDYFDISQKEAVKLLKDKFEVDLPDTHDKIRDFYERDIIPNNIKYDRKVSHVYARDSQLKYLTSYVYNQKEKTVAYMNMTYDFSYLPLKKEVILENQILEFKFFDVGKELSQATVDEMVKELGKIFKVDEIDKDLAGYHKELSKLKGKLANKPLTIFDNKKTKGKEKELIKRMVLTYNEEGKLSNLSVKIAYDLNQD